MASKFKVNGKDLIAKIEELIKEGNASRIIVRDEAGKTFIEIPVTVGLIGAVFAPVVTALGAIAGLAANYSIEVIHNTEREEGPAG